MAEKQELIPGISKKEEEDLIKELDGALSARDKIEAYKDKLQKHRNDAYKMLKDLKRESVVHNGHTFARETSHTLTINKLKKEGKGKAKKGDQEGEGFTPRKADSAAAS